MCRFRQSRRLGTWLTTRLTTRLTTWLAAVTVAAGGVTGIGLLATPAHAGLDGPMAADIDQHCLIESYSTRSGGTFTRRMDFVTVSIESLHGPGSAWVDYEVPGVLPRQAGPRGQFDPVHRSVAFTFPISQPPAGSSLVLYLGSVWSDGTTHQNHLALTPPGWCGQTSGSSADGVEWGNFAEARFSQQCVLAAEGPQLRWVSRVTVVLAVGTQYNYQAGHAWVDYWVANGGRADYRRATQGIFDLGSRTLTLTFDLPPARGGTELGIVGILDWDGRSASGHAWAPLRHCGWATQTAPHRVTAR